MKNIILQIVELKDRKIPPEILKHAKPRRIWPVAWMNYITQFENAKSKFAYTAIRLLITLQRKVGTNVYDAVTDTELTNSLGEESKFGVLRRQTL